MPPAKLEEFNFDRAVVVDTNDQGFDFDRAQVVEDGFKTVLDEETRGVHAVPRHYDADDTRYTVETEVHKKDKGRFFGMVDLGEDFVKSFAKGAAARALETPQALGSRLVEEGEVGGFGLAIKPLRLGFAIAREIRGKGVSQSPIDQRVAEAGRKMVEANKEFLKKLGLERTEDQGAKAVGFDLGSGATSVLTAIGLTVATKDPRFAGILFGQLQKSEMFSESRDAEKGAAASSLLSDVAGTVEGALEALGGEVFLRAITFDRVITRILFRVAEEFVQEGAQQTGEEIITQGTGIRNDDFKTVVQRIGYSAILGAVLAAPVGTAVSIAEKQGIIKDLKRQGFNQKQAELIVKVVSEKTLQNGEVIERAITLLDKETSPVNLSRAERAARMTEVSKAVEAELEGFFNEQAALDESQEERLNKSKFDLVLEKKLEEKVSRETERQDELSLLQERLGQVDSIIKMFNRRINKSKSGDDIREELQALPTQFSTREGGVGIDEALAEFNQENFGVRLESVSEFIEFIDQAVTEREALQGRIRKITPAMLRMRESTLLKQRLKDIERAFGQGKVKGRKEVKAVQEEVILALEQSSLPAEDKAKFIRAIKNIQTVEQFQKARPEIEARIDLLQTQREVRELKGRIKEALSATKPLNRSGKPEGKFTPEVQKILDRARTISKLTKAEAQEGLDKVLKKFEKLEDEGKLPSPEDALDARLFSIFAGLENKNVKELTEVAEDIEGLIEFGKGQSRLRKILRQERHEKLRARAEETVQGRNPAQNTDPIPRVWKRVSQGFQNFIRSGFTAWGDIMDELSQDDATKQEQSALYKDMDVAAVTVAEKRAVRIATESIVHRFLQAFNFTEERQGLKQMQEDQEKVDLGLFTDLADQPYRLEITKSEARKLWMEMQDETIKDVFTSKEGGIVLNNRHIKGLDEAAIKAVRNFLNASDLIFIQKQLDFYKRFYKRINAKYSEKYGIDLPFNEFYSPIARAVEGELPVDSFLREINFRRSVHPQSLKSRVENFQPVVVRSDMNVIIQHVIEMEHFINWVDKIQDMNAVFSNRRLRQIIEQKFGTGMTRVVDFHIAKFTTNGRTNAQGYDAVFRYLRTHFTISVLGLKGAIAVKQMVSFAAYAEFVPVKEFVAGVVDFLNPSDLKRKLDILQSSELIRARGQSITRDIKDALSSPEAKLFKNAPNWKNFMLLTTRFGDKAAIFLGGWPVYKHTLEQTGSPAKAMLAFETATDKTQQSGDLFQLSQWQQGGEFEKLFTMFMSAQNQYFRREYNAVRNLAKGRITKAEFAKKILIYHFFLPGLFQWVANFGTWDTKEELRAMILGSLNGLFLIQDVLDSLIGLALGLPLFDDDLPITEFKDGIVRAWGRLSDGYVDMEDILLAIGDLSKQTIGPLTGLPQQAVNGIEGLYDMSQGEFGKGALKLAGWSPFLVNKKFE